nr:CbiQ family ECF transporter T component [Staphylococcus lugdunensis]
MKNKLIIGRYLPTQSLIHELDPRAKLIFVFLFIITIFFAHSFTTFAWLLLIILAIMICAKIKLWFLLKGLTPIFVFLIFTFVMHIL